MKFIWKILLILIALVLLSYLFIKFFFTDSEVILKKPWFGSSISIDYVILEKAAYGETLEVYRGDRKVLWLQNQPGSLISTALLPAGTEPTRHPFINARALDPFEENNLQKLLVQSKSFEEFLSFLRNDGYLLKRVSQ